MRVIFKTDYESLGKLPEQFGDFKPDLESFDPNIRDWLVGYQIDWKSCIGATIRVWWDDPNPLDTTEFCPPGYGSIATDTWIELEDPKIATLFKLRWC